MILRLGWFSFKGMQLFLISPCFTNAKRPMELGLLCLLLLLSGEVNHRQNFTTILIQFQVPIFTRTSEICQKP